jgi:hypothetical protein
MNTGAAYNSFVVVEPWRVLLGNGQGVFLYDDSEWRTTSLPNRGTPTALFSPSADEAMVAFGADLELYQDGDWQTVCGSEPEAPMPCPGTTMDVWGESGDDFYTIDQGNVASELRRWVDGQPSLVRSIASGARSLAGASDRLVVGRRTFVSTFDGTAWSEEQPLSTTVNDVWMAAGGTAIAVGFDGMVAEFDGAVWAELPVLTDKALTTIDAIDHNEVWVLGSLGTVLRRRDGVWEKLPFIVGTPRAVAVTAPDDVFLLGGTPSWHNDGTWSHIGSPGSVVFAAAYPSRVFAAGFGQVYVLDRRVPWTGCETAEVCGNRIDDNCDGTIDEGCP